MKYKLQITIGLSILLLGLSCKTNKNMLTGDLWVLDNQEEWQSNVIEKSNLDIVDGKLVPTSSNEATFKSEIKLFDKKKSLKSITLSQSPEWLNWEPVSSIRPSNLGDAPIALQLGDGNYWMFGRYKNKNKRKLFKSQDTILKGYDIVLKTTPFKNQFDAPGGLKPGKRGYHAWQSTDMKNWVHHGAVSESFSRWMTTAEYVDGKFYFYYDFPNDQDPHLYIDEDLTDGIPGKNMGMAFKDPSDGSDCTIIRDLEGKFHIIGEDWSPVDASTHAWDSPLAIHAVSTNGFNDFKILNPPVDERTKSTGKFGEYAHPHWYKEAPDRFSGKTTKVDVLKHKIKASETQAYAKYEIHEPEQNAYGDWASISIGGQYYLFADFDKAGKTGDENMSVAWFTSNNINEQFVFCGNIGRGHPDPDIMFAEGKYYILTQTKFDYVSPGPWVETVELRVGVDTKNNGIIDTWGDWQVVSEHYDYIKGFSKQIEKAPAQINLSGLPEAYGFQVDFKINDNTQNKSKPIIDKMVVELAD